MTNQSNSRPPPKVRARKKEQYVKRGVATYVMVTSMYLMMLLAATAPVIHEIEKFEERKRRYVQIALQRKSRKRHSWSVEMNRHSNRMFYRAFRMKPVSFVSLCQRVEKAVGPSIFKSEEYLDCMLTGEESPSTSTPASRMYRNSMRFSGDYVSGE